MYKDFFFSLFCGILHYIWFQFSFQIFSLPLLLFPRPLYREEPSPAFAQNDYFNSSAAHAPRVNYITQSCTYHHRYYKLSINFTQQTKMKILYITKLVHSKSDVYYTNSLGERSGILLHNVVQSLYKNEKVNNINN